MKKDIGIIEITPKNSKIYNIIQLKIKSYQDKLLVYLMGLHGQKISKLSAPEWGYLFCNYCGGFYKLKKDESPHDFLKCECENPLEFCESKETLDRKMQNLNRKKEAFIHFENLVLERRENLKNFLPTVKIDDDFIKDVQEERGLQDLLSIEFARGEPPTNVELELSNRKKYLNLILEEERLMMNIQLKKKRVRNETLMDQIVYFHNQIDPICLLAVVIILLIMIIFMVVLIPV